MNTEISPPDLDSDLVERCTRGDRDAFGVLVARYQSLVCAQAYSVCGDLARSEDVAQDAFLNAWKQLPQLRDRSRFRGWICGIARNLALRVAEARKREAGPSLDTAEAGACTHELVAAREEEHLVWQALEELPENYRAALVLYYRENQSISAVAEALELTEEATRQRLARGRAMLKQQVEKVVETTLSRTRPSAAFTLAVLASLPLALPATASASTIAAAAKGGAAASTPWGLAAMGGLFGALAGFLGAWIGVKASAESTLYERERAYIFRCARRMAFVILLFLTSQFLGVYLLVKSGGKAGPWAIAGVASFVVLYLTWLIVEITRTNRALRKIRAEEQASGAPMRQGKEPWKSLAVTQGGTYRSQRTFLGLPLLHVVWSKPEVPLLQRKKAAGWIAVGDRPVGVIACGTFSVGVVSFGAFAGGLVTFGGIALGLFGFAGVALGVFVSGGFALGWEANGGMAVAWHIAHGGVALAKDLALGGIATAAQANSPFVAAEIAKSAWIGMAKTQWFSQGVPVVFCALFFVIAYLSSRKTAVQPSAKE